jgi:hypothetical protein
MQAVHLMDERHDRRVARGLPGSVAHSQLVRAGALRAYVGLDTTVLHVRRAFTPLMCVLRATTHDNDHVHIAS